MHHEGWNAISIFGCFVFLEATLAAELITPLETQKTNPDTQKANPDTQKTNADTQQANPDTQDTNPSIQKTIPSTQKTIPDTQQTNPVVYRFSYGWTLFGEEVNKTLAQDVKEGRNCCLRTAAHLSLLCKSR